MRRVVFFVVLMVLFFVYEVRGGLFDGVFTNFFDENGIKLEGGNVDRSGLDNYVYRGREYKLVYDCYYKSDMWLYSVAYSYGGKDKWGDFVNKIKKGKKAGNSKSEYDADANLHIENNKTNHLILEHTTGIDCSGFVQGFWRLYFAERYSNYVDYYGFTTNDLPTGGLPRISYRIPVWQITQYDALNNFGDHVVLFDRFDNSGNFGYSDLTSCYIYESGGNTNRVNIGNYQGVNPNRGMRYGKPSHPAIRTPFYKTNITKDYFTNNYNEFIRVLTNDPNNTHLPDIHNTNAMYMYLVGSNDNLASMIIISNGRLGNTMSSLNTNYLVYRFGLDDVAPIVNVRCDKKGSGFEIIVDVKDTQCAGIRVLDTTSKKINVLPNAFRVSLVGVGEITNVFGITNFVESYNGGPMVYRSYKNGNTVINSEGVRLWRIYNKLHHLQFLL